MDLLEEATHKLHNGYFVDLFARQSNANAIGMYHKARRACCLRADATMPLQSMPRKCMHLAVL